MTLSTSIERVFASPKNTPEKMTAFWIFMLATLVLFTPPIAFASGGIPRVNEFLDLVKNILQGAGGAVCTIAIMWSGYEMFFADQGTVQKAGKILGGGMLIGGAPAIAGYLIP